MSHSLETNKEITDDIREQLNLDLVVMENSCKKPLRDPWYGLNLEKNNNLWGDEHNPLEPHQEEFIVVHKKLEEGINLLN